MAFDYIKEDKKKKKPMREQYDPCIGKINKAYESLWVVVKKRELTFTLL